MCSESGPKEFEKTSEVLPFPKQGLSSMEEFKEAETKLQDLEKLKKAGLTEDEITLYKNNEAGTLEDQKKVESSVLKEKLDALYAKVKKFDEVNESDEVKEEAQPSTSSGTENKVNADTTYPEGHPMNNIKEMEQNLFGHLQKEVPPINKRRKMLRRFERKKQRIHGRSQLGIGTTVQSRTERAHSRREVHNEPELSESEIRLRREQEARQAAIRRLAMYTVKDDRLIRIEPLNEHVNLQGKIIRLEPIEPGECELLEGTKMSVDDIKKIDRYKDYEPGTPSKVLLLKNISPLVTEEQLRILFNQFILGNGGPPEVQLLPARARSKALVYFQNEETAIQALEETNGTIVTGRPIVAFFHYVPGDR